MTWTITRQLLTLLQSVEDPVKCSTQGGTGFERPGLASIRACNLPEESLISCPLTVEREEVSCNQPGTAFGKITNTWHWQQRLLMHGNTIHIFFSCPQLHQCGKKLKILSDWHPSWVQKCGSFDLLFSKWKEEQDFPFKDQRKSHRYELCTIIRPRTLAGMILF